VFGGDGVIREQCDYRWPLAIRYSAAAPLPHSSIIRGALAGL